MHTGNLMEDVVKCRTAYNAYFSKFLRIIHFPRNQLLLSSGNLYFSQSKSLSIVRADTFNIRPISLAETDGLFRTKERTFCLRIFVPLFVFSVKKPVSPTVSDVTKFQLYWKISNIFKFCNNLTASHIYLYALESTNFKYENTFAFGIPTLSR